MMVTLMLKQFHRKPITFEVQTTKALSLADLKRLWEAERILNELGDLRVHINTVGEEEAK